MSSPVNSDLIAQFCSITGTDTERAQFYLESSQWNIDLAVSCFFEGGPEEEDVAPPAAQQPQVPAPQPQPPTMGDRRIATLGGMREKEDSSSEEEGQAFYAGGSETSGQQIVGPRRKKKKAGEIIDDMFKGAKEHGAEEVQAGPSRGGAQGSGPSFSGSGFRLGMSEANPSEKIEGAAAPAKPRELDVTLKLWRNGFSLDNDDLRAFSEPDNVAFLDDIKKGQIPKELQRLAKGGQVNLDMEDHRGEDFVKPKQQFKAFGGEGQRLSSPAPAVVGASAAPAPATGGSGGGGAGAGNAKQQEEAANQQLGLDASQPTTNIQIRLADGSRLIAKFNTSHTLSDVRRYITTARPQLAGSAFTLVAPPAQELGDETMTLAAGKLLNAVVVVKITK